MRTINVPKHRPISNMFLEIIALFVCIESVLVIIDLCAGAIGQAGQSPHFNFSLNVTNFVASGLLSLYTGFFYLEGHTSTKHITPTATFQKRINRILIGYGTVILLLGIVTVCQTFNTPVTIKGRGKTPVTAFHVLYLLTSVHGATKMVACLRKPNQQ
jgi:hypothetical protein